MNKAEVDIKVLALMLYIHEEKKDVHETLVLQAVRAWRYIVGYCKIDHIAKVVKIPEKDIVKILHKLILKGEIVQNKEGYINLTTQGSTAWSSIRLSVSRLVEKMRP